MKVGLLIDDHMGRPGGVQEYVRGLGRYLQQQGHEVVVFSSGGPPDDVVRLVPLGSAIHLKGSGSSTSIPVTLTSSTRLKALLTAEGCDVLHVMAPYSPTLSGRLLVHSNAAHVMTFLVAINRGLYRSALGTLAKLQAPSLRRIHTRIAISETAAETAQALYGGNYTVIPCGVDTQHFTPNTSPLLARSGDTVNVLYVGRLEQRKGVAHLVRAFARIAGQYPQAQLLLGGNGPERESLERLVGQLGLTRVRFLGYVPASDLPRLLAAADIFCAPATYAESFGIVLIEAFAAGLPIVAAANPGYAGLLAHHPGNLLVPPADDRLLAGALAALIEQPVYRRRVGLRNHTAVDRYSWETVGSAILDVYKQVLR